MDDFIQAIESALNSKNWYGALFIGLSVPDICGYLQNPEENSQDRYTKWFEDYMLQKYSVCIGADATPHIFLSSADCYSLRCALLHEGRDAIEEQRAREALDRFHFIEPPSGGQIHCNQINNVLQLQVDIFCRNIIDGARQWAQDVQANVDIERRMKNLMKIYPPNEMP